MKRERLVFITFIPLLLSSCIFKYTPPKAKIVYYTEGKFIGYANKTKQHPEIFGRKMILNVVRISSQEFENAKGINVVRDYCASIKENKDVYYSFVASFVDDEPWQLKNLQYDPFDGDYRGDNCTVLVYDPYAANYLYCIFCDKMSCDFSI